MSKPERTSAGIGALLTADVFNTGDMAFVTGGTQKITDVMVSRLEGKVMDQAEVTRVEEKDGVVNTHFRRGE